MLPGARLAFGGFKTYMSDNSASNDYAKFAAFNCLRAEIPYSSVLQELRSAKLPAESEWYFGFQLQFGHDSGAKEIYLAGQGH